MVAVTSFAVCRRMSCLAPEAVLILGCTNLPDDLCPGLHMTWLRWMLKGTSMSYGYAALTALTNSASEIPFLGIPRSSCRQSPKTMSQKTMSRMMRIECPSSMAKGCLCWRAATFTIATFDPPARPTLERGTCTGHCS